MLLLERRELASGASGRNGGMTGAGSSLHSAAGRAVYALTAANLALMRDLPEELGTDIELRLPGTLDVATTPEQHAHLVESVRDQQASGQDVHLLDRAEARALMPPSRRPSWVPPSRRGAATSGHSPWFMASPTRPAVRGQSFRPG